MEVAASERYSPPPSFSLFLLSPFIPLKFRRSLCTLSPLHRRSLLPPLAYTSPSATISFWFARSEEQGEDRDRIEKVEGNGESSPRKRNTTSPAAIAGSPFSGSFVVAWGVDSPVRRESVSPFPTDPIEPGTTPVSWRQREDRVAGNIGGDRSKTPPPHVRGSESILSRCPSSPHAAMPMLAFSRRRMDIEIRYRLRDPLGLTIARGGEDKRIDHERVRYRCPVGSVDSSSLPSMMLF